MDEMSGKLLAALVVICTGIGGLFVWIVKWVAPAYLEAYKERTLMHEREAKEQAASSKELGDKMDHLKDAMIQLSSNLATFQQGVMAVLREHKDAIVAEIRDNKTQIIAVVQDRKIADLEETIHRNSKTPPESKMPRR